MKPTKLKDNAISNIAKAGKAPKPPSSSKESGNAPGSSHSKKNDEYKGEDTVTLTDMSLDERVYLNASLQRALHQKVGGADVIVGDRSSAMSSFSRLPQSIASIFLYVFNAAVRRRVIDVHITQISSLDGDTRREALSSTPTRESEAYETSSHKVVDADLSTFYVTSRTQRKRFLYCRQILPSLAPFLAEVLYFELELTSLTTGSFENNLHPRILQPLSKLKDISAHVSSPSEGKHTEQPPEAPSASLEKVEEATSAPESDLERPSGGGWGSAISSFLGGRRKSLQPNFDSQLAKEDSNNSESPRQGGKSKANDDNSISAGKSMYNYNFGKLKKNISNLVTQTFSGVSSSLQISSSELSVEMDRLESLERFEASTTVVRLLRTSAILLLETLREKVELRKQVLLFILQNKSIFFSQMPVPNAELPRQGSSSQESRSDQHCSDDFMYCAALSFYFYQCLFDNDSELTLRALLCWGHILCSETLAVHARQLVELEVSYIIWNY